MNADTVVLDTNVVSYLMKDGPLADAYRIHIQGKTLAISFISVGELYFGAEKANWGAEKRQNLESTIRGFTVIPYDHEIARLYATIAAGRRRTGAPISLHDAWIAACALRHALPLVTHNPKDFESISGLQVISAHSIK